MQRTAGHTRLLLMLAGDIESNPGPQSNEDLINGLAELIGEAPSSMREVLCVWCPDKPSNDAVNELNSRKFTVPVLQPALAWLLNKDVTDPVVKSMRKGELAQAIVLGIERLLPDTCGECSEVYTVGRDEIPGLICKGCGQGFHQKCLEKLLDGKSALPRFPGSLYWLCGSCSPCFELVNTVGQGNRNIASNEKINPVVDTIGEAINIPTPPPPPGSEVSGAVEQSVGLDRNLVSDLTKSGLPFLWNCDRSTNAPSYASPNPQPRFGEVREAPLLVKVGLPFLWGGDIGRGNVQECELYLQGICPHGVSGKTNGGCQRLHRKRCSKFMKWGNKGENMYKVVHCD